jgi:hypothetical protein
MGELTVQPATEFQALPLEFIVAAPLVAAVRAQAVAAKTTQGFIESMLVVENNVKKPVVVEFNVTHLELDAAGKPLEKTVKVNAPLLSMVPVPHLRIDSLTTHFRYEISETVRDTSETAKSLDLSVESGAALSLWAKGTLKGSVSSKSAEESTMNRSGVLEITVHASEAPMPEGLAHILDFLGKAVQMSLPSK